MPLYLSLFYFSTCPHLYICIVCMYICLNCINLYLNVYCQCLMLTVCTKGLRVTQFQFSVCMYCTCGRIDNKADLTWLDLTKNNVPQCQIAKALQIASSTVHNIIKRFRETREISVRKGQGRITLLDAHVLQTLKWHCITHRHDSVIGITKWAQEYFQKPLSVNTIRRAICKAPSNEIKSTLS